MTQSWEGDLLGRRKDGEAIESFLVNRAAALINAGRQTGFTLAIDGEYGTGKTFLLRNLCKQVKLSHPAAFIDAWADDTIDAPWAALLVALDEALKPFEGRIDQRTKSKLKKKSVQLIAALAKGAAKKGASYVIGDEGWDDAVEAIFEKEGETKIAAYQDRKKAISELRQEIQNVLSCLDGETSGPPLFVFIDELDRCRPTYAIQFLEEIKHIFDIPNIVFVLAINTVQLSKAVSALYGNEFNGVDYLRRFIDKTYTVFEPNMVDLVRYHCRSVELSLDKFDSPGEGNDRVSDFIAKSCEYWDVKPRDTIRVIDALATAEALWPHNVPLQLELLLPLVISATLNRPRASLMTQGEPRRVPRWPYFNRHQTETRNPKEIFLEFWNHRKQNFFWLHNHAPGVGGIERRIIDILSREVNLRPGIDLNSKTLMSRYTSLAGSLSHFSTEIEPGEDAE